VNRLRAVPAVLALALLTLTACGGGESTEPTAAPTSGTPAASAPAPTSGSPATSAPAASAPAAGQTRTDKQLCQQITMEYQMIQQRIVKEAAGGDPSPALAKKLLTDLEKQMTAVVSGAAPGSTVAPAITEMAGHVGKLAAAADPAAADDDPAAEKAAKALNTACTKAGAPTNF
jgi:hypothetical protein